MAKDSDMDAEYDAVHETAADWFARLQDPNLSLDDTLSWQSWMSADRRHAQAFRRIEETWQRFRGLPRPALASEITLAADTYNGSVPVSQWLTMAPASQLRRHSLKLALAASIAVVAVGAALVLYLDNSSNSAGSVAGTIVETAVGENRTVKLADGSSIALGGRTRVEVALSADFRRLTLSHGEAFFVVAKDPSRPFSVHAGSATLTALGTAFNVRRADDRIVVAVVEGRVLVEPRLPVIQQLPLLRETVSKKRRPLPLEAGNQTTVDEAGFESAARLADNAAATAWQTGRLAFEREPLRYVLEDVNRYTSKPIVMSDDSVGDLKITGTVLSDNIGGWVSSLESAFALQAIDERDRIVLKRKP